MSQSHDHDHEPQTPHIPMASPLIPSATFSPDSKAYTIDWAGFDPYHSLLRDANDPRNGSNGRYVFHSNEADAAALGVIEARCRRARDLFTSCDNVGFISSLGRVHYASKFADRYLGGLPTNLAYLDLLAVFYLRLEMKACTSPACGRLCAELDRLVPHYYEGSWPGLRAYVVQVAACGWAWYVHNDYRYDGDEEYGLKYIKETGAFFNLTSNTTVVTHWTDKIIRLGNDGFPESLHLFPDGGMAAASFPCKAPINLLGIDTLFEWLDHCRDFQVPWRRDIESGRRQLPDIERTRKGLFTTFRQGSMAGALRHEKTNLNTLLSQIQRQVPHVQLDEVVPKFQTTGVCSKRLMAVIQSLPGRGDYLPLLLAELRARPVLVPRGAERHEECLTDHCVYDVVNHTNVSQLHKCSDPRECRLTPEGMFGRELLDEAALAGRPTAWALDGRTLLEPGQRYMAVSHIWADGTGVGMGHSGRVNECLWAFFRGVAEQAEGAGCEGIWWDAISIPGERRAKAAVLDRMHEHYGNALFSFVHDRFLLETPWEDVGGRPCMAMLFSPWFGRGWTALELAKSRAVKVAFLAPPGTAAAWVLKDLDSEVMSRVGRPCPNGHRIASWVIEKYRKGAATHINDILVMLKPRTTSWAADTPIIAALLADLHIANIAKLTQLKINQAILKRLPNVHAENLFHTGQPGVGGFAWCPSSILDLGVADASAQAGIRQHEGSFGQHIFHSGDMYGAWEAAIIPKPGHSPAALAHPVATPASTHPIFRANMARRIASAQTSGSTFLYLLCNFHAREGEMANEKPAIMVEVLSERPRTRDASGYGHGLSSGQSNPDPIHAMFLQGIASLRIDFVCRYVGCVYVNIDLPSDLSLPSYMRDGTVDCFIYLTCNHDWEKWSPPDGSTSFVDYFWNKSGLMESFTRGIKKLPYGDY
ncbi:hypothetical protein DFH27DRAFT_552472 [Peziza echinospora]|nr:hypothetical protein DFH27DRAFT_552472 [Peziza echinospora]